MKLLLGLLCITFAALAAAQRECNSPTVVTDVALDVAAHPDGKPTVADVYGCFEGQPLVVLFPGFGQPKERYSLFATALAKKRFNVLVPFHGVGLGPPGSPLQNLVSPPVLTQAIEWAKTQSGIDVDSTTLIGHSFGGGQMFYTLQGECPIPFCFPPNTAYALPAELRVAMAYGTSLSNRFGSGFVEGVSNMGFPVFWANGDGDQINLSDADGTFDRLVSPKAYSIIENMDHFSISNDVYSERENEVLSTRSRQDQVDEVVETVALWIDEQLNDDSSASSSGDGDSTDISADGSFCDVLFDERESTVDCVEDFS